MCGRRMAWLGEIGWKFVTIVVKSDNEPALSSLVESWRNLRAMKGVSRMNVENSPVGQLEGQRNCGASYSISSGHGQNDTQLTRSTVVGVFVEFVHSIWPWIAEHAGFLLTRFQVGHERRKGRTAKLHAMMFAEGNFVEQKTCRKSTWKA